MYIFEDIEEEHTESSSQDSTEVEVSRRTLPSACSSRLITFLELLQQCR